MKFQIAAALAGVCIASAAPAFAQGPGEHPNGTVQASMMADGNVKMIVTLPPAEAQAIERAMQSSGVACMVKEMFPGSRDTMVFECDNVTGVGG